MEHVRLTEEGFLPPDTDVDRVVETGDERAAFALRNTYFHRRLWQQMLDQENGTRELWEPGLAVCAEVTPLQALEASHRLAELISGGRWHLMRDAREAGESWSKIGAALGMTKQGAQDWYRRKIAEQERVLAELHDGDRARAVLDDAEDNDGKDQDPGR